MKHCIAIITARGGSKRIPQKNIKNFCGKPIIAYSIESALSSQIFDEVMVSTDSEEIAEISKQYGANVPFMRSAKTSDDYATTDDVLREVIQNYKDMGKIYHQLVCIYPTAPFVTAEKLKKALQLLNDTDADEVLPVVAYSFPPQRAHIIKDGLLRYQYPEYINYRSQDLSTIYHDCGQFDAMKTDTLFKDAAEKLVIPMIIPELEVQDIDNETDWKLAELKYSFMRDKK